MIEKLIDLGAEETPLASYRFQGGGTPAREAVLTSKRLIFIHGSVRESHPLARIRAVRVEAGRNWLYFILFAACTVVGLAVPLIVGAARLMTSSISDAAVDQHMNQGYIFAALGSAFGFACAWGSWLAYRGYTRLAIELDSGVKTYTVQAQDPDLLVFVTKIEHAL